MAKINTKSRLAVKKREPRYISFEDDLISDVSFIDSRYTETEVKHVYNALIRTIKRKAKEYECFSIATPIGEFYLKTAYMERFKDRYQEKCRRGTATRGNRDKLIRFVYKLQLYKETRSYWAETFGMYFKGRGKKLYLHDMRSITGTWPYTKKEREELQNMIL